MVILISDNILIKYLLSILFADGPSLTKNYRHKSPQVLSAKWHADTPLNVIINILFVLKCPLQWTGILLVDKANLFPDHLVGDGRKYNIPY